MEYYCIALKKQNKYVNKLLNSHNGYRHEMYEMTGFMDI
jgi:hypothetical protein